MEQTNKLGTNLWLATPHVPPSNAHKCAVASQLAELDGDSEASRWPKAMMDRVLLVMGLLGCVVCDHRCKDSTTARKLWGNWPSPDLADAKNERGWILIG